MTIGASRNNRSWSAWQGFILGYNALEFAPSP
jgi:hypothetical protein